MGRQIVVSIIVHSLMFALSLVGVKILTNVFSVSTYGIYSLVFATIGILSICLELGFHGYLITKVPGEERTKGFSYFTTNFIFKLIVLIIFATLAIGVGVPLIRHYNLNASGESVILSVFILMFSLLVAETLRFHSLRKRLEFTSIMHLFTEKSWILLFFLFWWPIQKITLDQILLIRLLPLIPLLFVSFWLMKRNKERVGDNKLFDKRIVREGFVFGAPLIILGLGHVLLVSADRYVIALFMSTSAVGYYFLVYALMNMAYTVASSLYGVSLYHFAEAYNLGKKNKLQFLRSKDIFNCSLKLSLVVSLFLCAILALLRLPVIQIVSKEEYLVAAEAMLILSPFPVFLVLGSMLGQMLFLEKQRKVLVKGYVSAVLLNVILNFALVPKFGINGAAIATVISYLFMFLFFLLKIRKYHILEFPKFQLVKLVVCLILAIAPIYLLNPISIVELLYSGTISVIIYLLSLLILKVVTRQDWNILRRNEILQTRN